MSILPTDVSSFQGKRSGGQDESGLAKAGAWESLAYAIWSPSAGGGWLAPIAGCWASKTRRWAPTGAQNILFDMAAALLSFPSLTIFSFPLLNLHRPQVRSSRSRITGIA